MMCMILVAGLLLQIGSYVVQLDPESMHQSENLVWIVSQVLFTASLWIGLYTFYLFVTQPYNSALNRSYQRSSQIGDKLASSQKKPLLKELKEEDESPLKASEDQPEFKVQHNFSEKNNYLEPADAL